MHNQSLNVNQIDMMDSTDSLVDYYHNGANENRSSGPPPDYRSRAQLTEDA
jgi:hypothetical protein